MESKWGCLTLMNKSLCNKNLLLLLGMLVALVSCGSKNEATLTMKDIAYINTIIPLEKDEQIQLFETNAGFGGLRVAGNLITNQRLVHYWQDGRDEKVQAATYDEIDALKLIDRRAMDTYASYIQVYCSDESVFKVYVDADSTRLMHFFDQAQANWLEHHQD